MNVDDARRLNDLRAALKRVKPNELFSLDDVALLWGTSKSRFVTVRDQMATFPAPQPAPKEMGLAPKAYVYPARAAIEAMLAHATRHEDIDRAKAERTAAMLGQRRVEGDAAPLHNVNELQTVNRLAAEIEERERAQGLYIPVAEVAAVAGELFSELSEFVSELANRIDPHGSLAPDVRLLIADQGKEALLLLHRRLKDMLRADAVAKTNRDQADRAGQPRARRPRKGSVRQTPR